MKLPTCEKHRADAGWKCTRCHRLLCPDCVATQRVQIVTELEVCLHCGEMVERLTRHRSAEKSYFARLPSALNLGKAGFAALVGTALLRTVVGYAPGLGWLLSWCILATVCFAIIRGTSRGEDGLASFDFSDYLNDLLVPGVKALAGAAIVWVPAVMWVAFVHPPGKNPEEVIYDPVIWLLLLAGVAYAPMAILVGASGESLIGMLNPLSVVRHALRLGTDYFIAVATLCLLLFPWLLLSALATMFLPPVIDYTFSSYVPFVAARVLGLLLYTRGDAVGYGIAADYRVPVLAGAPRGVAPEKHVGVAPGPNPYQPIELEPEAPSEWEAPAEPARPRLTELDPAALPPLEVEPEE